MQDSTPTPVPSHSDHVLSHGVVSHGWLAETSEFEHQVPGWKQRLYGASGASIVAHVAMFLLVIFLLSVAPDTKPFEPPPPMKTDLIVHLQVPGPGGGGGGSPAPAPPKPLEIPKAKPPEPVPVAPPPPPTPEPPKPVPVLNAPVMTNMANVVQSSGSSSISLAQYGGGGRGGGIGSGTGNGVGEGTGGGFGGGAYRPGSGVTNPVDLKKVEPKYTSEAMRAKITGEVELEVVIEANGTVGDMRVVKSLDRTFGLDEEAKKAAKQWLFRPATFQGKPVPIVVRLVLEFRLH
jgi:TonB family protein